MIAKILIYTGLGCFTLALLVAVLIALDVLPY
jgi:hypothetical protein